MATISKFSPQIFEMYFKFKALLQNRAFLFASDSGKYRVIKDHCLNVDNKILRGLGKLALGAENKFSSENKKKSKRSSYTFKNHKAFGFI